MKQTLAAVVTAAWLMVQAPAAVAAQAASQSRADDAAKLSEAHDIASALFPPGQRQQMVAKLQAQIAGQLHSYYPDYLKVDAGVEALVDAYINEGLARERPIIEQHFPAMIDAMSRAYAREFSLAELKQIRAFAQSPAGAHYLTSQSAIRRDPEVAKADNQMIAEINAACASENPAFKERLTAYLTAHPDAAAKVAAAAKDEAN